VSTSAATGAGPDPDPAGILMPEPVRIVERHQRKPAGSGWYAVASDGETRYYLSVMRGERNRGKVYGKVSFKWHAVVNTMEGRPLWRGRVVKDVSALTLLENARLVPPRRSTLERLHREAAWDDRYCRHPNRGK
jgi:hypothetical protein